MKILAFVQISSSNIDIYLKKNQISYVDEENYSCLYEWVLVSVNNWYKYYNSNHNLIFIVDHNYQIPIELRYLTKYIHSPYSPVNKNKHFISYFWFNQIKFTK